MWNDDFSRTFFHFFEILIFLGCKGRGGGGKRAKNCQMKNNNYIHHMPYLRNSVAYHDVWYTFVKWWYLQVFFSFFFFFFFSFLFFRLLGRWKGKTWPKMTKKFCLVRFISQELYIIWLSFMVHLCKMMISPGVFFHFFKIFDSMGCYKGRGGGCKGAKNCPKWEKILSTLLHITGIIHHMIFIYGTQNEIALAIERRKHFTEAATKRCSSNLFGNYY